MPTYEYRCNKCGEHFEVSQSFSDKPLERHPGKCRGKVVKVLSAAGIVFSGSGFYKTDNKDSSRSRSKSRSEKSDSSSSSSSSDSGSSSSGSSSSSSSDSSSGSSTKSDTSSKSSSPTP